MINVLITGGAGYKGTLLTQRLLEKGCSVTVLDNFMYGYDTILSANQHENCSVISKDIRNIEKSDVEPFDFIYHLAAISGYPACEDNPHSAQTINVDSTKKLVDLLNDDQILVYASTTSMYGRSGKYQDEESKPTPTSLYGMTKLAAEKLCMSRKNSVAFRFATLFGSSLKMRCDLLVNDFTYKAVTERSLVLFDSDSVRTFLHVRDAIQAYADVLNRPSVYLNEIFNVGADSLNYSKLQIAETIANSTPVEIVQSQLDDMDPRNFVIGFSKIAKTGFTPTVSLEAGIQELVDLYQWYRTYKPYKTI